MSSWSVCIDCKVKYSHQWSRTKRSYCHECSSFQLDEQDAELKILRSENQTFKKLRSDHETVQSRLQFLCPQKQLDNKVVDGILKGDVRIIVQGRRDEDEDLFAHKFVLSSRSSVFCKMFDAKMLEEETGTVFIGDASHDVVKAVIKFCYDAEIDFTDGVTSEEVLEVAHKYDIGLLQEICEKQLITTLSCENLPKMLKIARKFTLTDLKLAASQFFKGHFDNVIENVLEEIL